MNLALSSVNDIFGDIRPHRAKNCQMLSTPYHETNKTVILIILNGDPLLFSDIVQSD